MALLYVTPETNSAQVLVRTQDDREIAEILAPLGVRFENWPLGRVSKDASDEAVIEAYTQEIEAFNSDGRYRKVEAIQMRPDEENPQWVADVLSSREKYFNEHTHSEDEIWFFADGGACFYLRAGDRVHILLCTDGNLLSLPARMRHWFDMGLQPDYRALRLYLTTEGFDGDFTGDRIADGFPYLETVRVGVADAV